ncbi:phosphonate metabolism protein/1,5-bisphosphokinase (PRPP-forming) PhnN [Mesorhizobium tianshanense]|nr:phosphonate metabolism protein/1,5-bisphosphokinase (PRPP-forming) PhnN [Mesorhizobium tianshanense]
MVLIVGPSGSGKDTLLDYARERLRLHPGFRFVRRIITRPASPGEDHESVSEHEFQRLVSHNAFSLNWTAHGLSYGLPAAVDQWLADGTVVIANGSREVLPQARLRFPRLQIVNITAPSELLQRRLAERGRETGKSIRDRLARSETIEVVGSDVHNIDNSGPPAVAGEEFLRLLTFGADGGGAHLENS